MANEKISNLNPADPLDGTEELPIVQSGSTVKTTINAIATFFGFVKKGTLTTNYIPKATASDTIGDSNITDNGTTVNISVTNSQIVASGTSSYINFDNGVKSGYLQNSATSTIVSHTDLIELNAQSVTKNGVEVATVNDIPSSVKLFSYYNFS